MVWYVSVDNVNPGVIYGHTRFATRVWFAKITRVSTSAVDWDERRVECAYKSLRNVQEHELDIKCFAFRSRALCESISF